MNSQVDRVYQAEWEWWNTVPQHNQWLSIREAQQFINSVVNGPVWKRWVPTRQPVVLRVAPPDLEHGQAEENARFIVVPTELQRKLPILHEMAHILCMRLWKLEDQHGPEFTWAHEQLVLENLGVNAALLLGKLYQEQGVRVSPVADLPPV